MDINNDTFGSNHNEITNQTNQAWSIQQPPKQSKKSFVDSYISYNEHDKNIKLRYSELKFTYGTIYILSRRAVSLELHDEIWEGGENLAKFFIRAMEDASAQANRMPTLLRLLGEQDVNFIELGAGTGIAGLTLAILLHFHYANYKGYLTDLPEARDIVSSNININEENLMCKINCEFTPLDWKSYLQYPLCLLKDINLIIVADCLYNYYGLNLELINTIKYILNNARTDCIVLFSYVIRKDTDNVMLDCLSNDPNFDIRPIDQMTNCKSGIFIISLKKN